MHWCIAACTRCVFGAPQVTCATVMSSCARSLIRRKLQARHFSRATNCRRDRQGRAHGTTCARSQVHRNCASDCAMQCASNVQRMTAVTVLALASARQTRQLCGAAAIRTRAPAWMQSRICGVAPRQRAGATPRMRSATLTQSRATETGAEACSIGFSGTLQCLTKIKVISNKNKSNHKQRNIMIRARTENR